MIRRNVPIAVLFILFILSVFPKAGPDDLNKDGKVGLEDAILSVRMLHETAQAPGNFTQAFETTVSTLSILAGLCPASLESDTDKSSTVSLKNSPPCFTAAHFIPAPEKSWSGIFEPSIHFFNYTIDPPTPPA